jgi:hypothetical protein
MGELLERAEQLFGKTVMGWTPIGVQVGKGDQPALMPLGDTDKRYISFSRAVDIMGNVLFETAHEVVHPLGPVPAANALEEGVAAWFSLQTARRSQRLIESLSPVGSALIPTLNEFVDIYGYAEHAWLQANNLVGRFHKALACLETLHELVVFAPSVGGKERKKLGPVAEPSFGVSEGNYQTHTIFGQRFGVSVRDN